MDARCLQAFHQEVDSLNVHLDRRIDDAPRLEMDARLGAERGQVGREVDVGLLADLKRCV